MTPTELMTYVRQRYNAVGDDLFSDTLLLNMIYDASMTLSKKAYVIERTYTTSTVVSQQEYDWPTNAFAIKRITYNGQKLSPINFREDDAMTLSNSATTATGTPCYYALFNRTFYLRPIPDAVQTLKVFSYNFPQSISTTSTIEIPSEYHLDLALYMLAEMHAVEKNYEGSNYYRNLWDKRVSEIKTEQRKRVRADSFAGVQDVDSLPTSLLDLV